MNCKGRIFIAEILASPTKEQGKDSFSVSLLFCEVLATIHEGVLCSGVAMKVTIEDYISRFKSFLHHLFHCMYLREEFGTWVHPLPIEITSRKA